MSSPSALGEIDGKRVHTSKRANIVSPSNVAELHDGCFLIVFVVVLETTPCQKVIQKIGKKGRGSLSFNVNRK